MAPHSRRDQAHSRNNRLAFPRSGGMPVAYDLRLGGRDSRDQQESAVGDEVVPKSKVGTGFQNRTIGRLFGPFWEQTAFGIPMSITIWGLSWDVGRWDFGDRWIAE